MHDSTPERDPSQQRRLEAAERTVAVLKRRVLDLDSGTHTLSLHRQLENVRRRDEANRQKRELAEVSAAALARHSERLEIEVAARTRAIKTILDHVTFGFLIVDRELVVQPESTLSCLRLFAVDRVEGKNLSDLLALGDHARQNLLLGVDQLYEDIMPEDISLEQLPRKAALGGRTLRMEPSVVRDEHGAVSGLLLTISDITALEAVTRENDNNQTLIGILRQKESFRAFLAETKDQLDDAAEGVAGGRPHEVRRALHTIKGNAASFGLVSIVETIHQIEGLPEISGAQVDLAVASVRDFLASNFGVLEIAFDEIGDEGFDVSLAQMDALAAIVSELPMPDAARMRQWVSRVLERPASLLLGPVEQFTERLAERLEKKVALELVGADTLVDVEVMRPVFAVISQLLRNAVDHGIELAHERGEKAERATVRLAIAERDAAYWISCHDDGRGIDIDRLSERAVETGLLAAQTVSTMSHSDRNDLIFLDGLSSAKVATSISGRGVGMASVKVAVERAGGRVVVETSPGLGTTFTMVVPKRTAFLRS